MKKYRLLKPKIIGGVRREAGDVVTLSDGAAATLMYWCEPVQESPSTAAELKVTISGTTDVSTLDHLERSETNRPGGGRKSVFKALDDRRDELTGGEEE